MLLYLWLLIKYYIIHVKTPYVATVLWLASDDVVTILSPARGTSGRLQNRVSVPDSYSVSVCNGYLVFPCSDHAVAY